MSQVYHSNARTNQHVREIIQNSDLTNVKLADKYNVNVKTIAKYRKRDFLIVNISNADCKQSLCDRYSGVFFCGN